MPDVSLSHMIKDNDDPPPAPLRKPKWIRAQIPGAGLYSEIRELVAKSGLNTVCAEAKCPNLGECWQAGVATIMILGDTCTRACGFCHVKTGKPPITDYDEPERVANAVRIMNLKYLVITSVDRDDLSDGGATIWADTIRAIHADSPQTSVEVLIPDLQGDPDDLQTIVDAQPAVLAHNLETVERMHRVVRPQAKYERSIEVLRRAKDSGMVTKTGIMVGIGETDDEVSELMHDVYAKSECDILTIGQYLQPTPKHLPVDRFVEPAMFETYKTEALRAGFRVVESGPMVRSSYHADKLAAQLNSTGERTLHSSFSKTR